MVKTTTHNIRLLSNQSTGGHSIPKEPFFFVYYITITNHSDCTVKLLLKRLLGIKDSNGEKRMVDGDGEWLEKHRYWSRARFDTAVAICKPESATWADTTFTNGRETGSLMLRVPIRFGGASQTQLVVTFNVYNTAQSVCSHCVAKAVGFFPDRRAVWIAARFTTALHKSEFKLNGMVRSLALQRIAEFPPLATPR